MEIHLDQTSFDALFEDRYKPFRSRNARVMYNTFIKQIRNEYLTTLDIQEDLEYLGIDLSKKEINAWLRSLQQAGLIVKDEERGKPTTVSYEDKYTFDKWRLTEDGVATAGELDLLLSSNDVQIEELKEDQQDISGMGEATTSHAEGLDYMGRLLLLRLDQHGGMMPWEELRKEIVSDEGFSALVRGLQEKGLVALSERSDRSLLFRLLSLFGFVSESPIVQLTSVGLEYAGYENS